MLSLNDLFMKIFNGTATGDKRKWRVVNIVGTKPGLIRGSKYVLSAHYDSAPKSPGANDNGSGVAGLLEIAQICSKYTFKNSIDFIGFDQEERDLLGSGVFVFGKNSLYNKKSVKGVVNLDMIGTYSEKAGSQKIPEGFEKLFKETSQRISLNKFKGDFAVISSNENSKALGASFVEASRGYVPALKEEHLTVAGVGDEVPQFQKSDHFVFWMDSVQSIHVGDGADTRSSTYHTPQDKMEYVNIGFSTLIAKATLATVLELAEICHCSSASFAFSSQNLQADGQKK
jgi:Zn-dependent M28 family amino/carboxypeptidase